MYTFLNINIAYYIYLFKELSKLKYYIASYHKLIPFILQVVISFTFTMGKGRYIHPVAQLENDDDFHRQAKVLEATGTFSVKELKVQRRLHKHRLSARKSNAKRALNRLHLKEENNFLQVSFLCTLTNKASFLRSILFPVYFLSGSVPGLKGPKE